MIIVGIDGGGTKTHYLVVNRHGTLLSHRHGGPSNIHRIGVNAVADEIHHTVRALVDQQGEDQVVVAACLSGIDTDVMLTELTDALRRRQPGWTWLVDNDATAAWWGAFGAERPGVVTIAGTGTVSLARADGRAVRVGGWGALLGDEGSGYSLGRGAMVAVLRAHDGLDRPTALREPVLEALGLSECQQLIDHVHCSMSFSDVAALAPLVVSVAEQGDPAAEDVVRVAAAALVEFATTAATRVLAGHDEGPLDAAFVGGLAVNPYYRSHIRTLLSQNSTVCRWVEPATRPVLGAVLMGAHHLQILSTWDASLLAKIDPFTQE